MKGCYKGKKKTKLTSACPQLCGKFSLGLNEAWPAVLRPFLISTWFGLASSLSLRTPQESRVMFGLRCHLELRGGLGTGRRGEGTGKRLFISKSCSTVSHAFFHFSCVIVCWTPISWEGSKEGTQAVMTGNLGFSSGSGTFHICSLSLSFLFYGVL